MLQNTNTRPTPKLSLAEQLVLEDCITSDHAVKFYVRLHMRALLELWKELYGA